MGYAHSKVKPQTKQFPTKLRDKMRSRLPSQQGRSASPPPQPVEHSSFKPQAPIVSADTSATPAAHPLLALESVPTIGASIPVRAATPTEPAVHTSFSSEALCLTSLPTVLSTTELAIKDLAGRYGSDLLPSLKIALAALVELAESWDVSH